MADGDLGRQIEPDPPVWRHDHGHHSGGLAIGDKESAARTSAPDWAWEGPCRRPSVKGSGCEWDVRYAPAAQVLIECHGIFEHESHVGDAADVPRPNVLIKRTGRVEHYGHIRDATDVP